MTKRRPSIKGRGAEILFGEPPPPATPPLEGENPAAGDELMPTDLPVEPEGDAMAASPREPTPSESEPAPPDAELSTEGGVPPEGEAMAATSSPPEPEPAAAAPDNGDLAVPPVEDLPDLEPVPSDSLRELHSNEAAGPPPTGPAPEMPGTPGSLAVEAQPSSPSEPAQPEPGAVPSDEDVPNLEAIPTDALRETLEGEAAGPPSQPSEGGTPSEGGMPPSGSAAPVSAVGVEGLVEPRPAAPVDTAFAPAPGAQATEPVAASPAAVEGSAPLDESDLEQALYQEARDGEPGAAETAPPVAAEATPPAQEMDAAFINEAIAAEEPPEPVAETPSPTLEATMDEQNASAETATHEPPPPETSGDAAGSVVPPRPERMLFDLSPTDSVTTADVQGSAGRVGQIEVNAPLTAEEQAQLLARLGNDRLAKLDREITRTYQRVLEVVGDNPDLSNEVYNLLLKARDIVWRREASRIAQAEYYLEQAQARMKRAEDSMQAAKRYQWRILGWGVGWGLLFIALWILLSQDWFLNLFTPAAASTTNTGGADIRVFLNAMVWGGIGGVAAVLYSLFKHVGDRDFDSAFMLSYVGKPFLGLILGTVVYMAFHLLMRVLGLLPTGLQGQTFDAIEASRWIIYLVAFAGGFKENRVLDLVDKVMKRLFSGTGGEAAPPPAATPTPTPPPAASEGTNFPS